MLRGAVMIEDEEISVLTVRLTRITCSQFLLLLSDAEEKNDDTQAVARADSSRRTIVESTTLHAICAK